MRPPTIANTTGYLALAAHAALFEIGYEIPEHEIARQYVAPLEPSARQQATSRRVTIREVASLVPQGHQIANRGMRARANHRKGKIDSLGRRGSPSLKKLGNQDDSTQEAWGGFTSEPPQVACAARPFSMNKAGRARDLNRLGRGRPEEGP